MTSVYEMNQLKARVDILEKQVEKLIAAQHTPEPSKLYPTWVPTIPQQSCYTCPACGKNPPAVCGNVACPGAVKVTC